MNILYIDDCQDSLSFVQDLLEEEGFNVIICQESHESLKILDENKIHCIITDLKMPILEGNQLIPLFKKTYPDIPVIVLSAHIKSKQAILDLGACEALDKPVSTSLLITTIHNSIAETSGKITLTFENTNLKHIKETAYRRVIALVLKKHSGNQVKASAELGISRQSLRHYIKNFHITPS